MDNNDFINYMICEDVNKELGEYKPTKKYYSSDRVDKTNYFRAFLVLPFITLSLIPNMYMNYNDIDIESPELTLFNIIYLIFVVVYTLYLKYSDFTYKKEYRTNKDDKSRVYTNLILTGFSAVYCILSLLYLSSLK